MALLRGAIRQLATWRLAMPRLRLVPSICSVAAKLGDGDGIALPGIPDPAEIAPAIRRKLQRQERLTTKELRRACWCIWQTELAISDEPGLLAELLKQIEDNPRDSPGRALAGVFLHFFRPDRTGIDVVSTTLQRMSVRLGPPWSDLHSQCDLLDWRKGPARIASLALEVRKSPAAMLAAAGLRNRDLLSGYVEASTAQVLTSLTTRKDISAAERLGLVQAMALNDQGGLLFPVQGPLVADALILPFASSEPPENLKPQYLELVLHLFKDPRLNPGNWVRMEAAAEVVRRWLTRESLRQFLDVVNQVAVAHMWYYRRKFWEAVYSAGLIDDAWVVFDRDGAQVARRAFGKEIAFARFDGTVQPGQSVLLLRIGRGVVAEWSHNGQCNIWNDADSKSAPRLYRSYYAPDQLRSGGSAEINRPIFAVRHLQHTGPNSWQVKVAAKIHQMTGYRLKSSEWM